MLVTELPHQYRAQSIVIPHRMHLLTTQSCTRSSRRCLESRSETSIRDYNNKFGIATIRSERKNFSGTVTKAVSLTLRLAN